MRHPARRRPRRGRLALDGLLRLQPARPALGTRRGSGCSPPRARSATRARTRWRHRCGAGRAGAIGVLFTEMLSYAFDDPGRGAVPARHRVGRSSAPTSGSTLLPVPPDGPGRAGGRARQRRRRRDRLLAPGGASGRPRRGRAPAAARARRHARAAPASRACAIDDRGGARAVAEHVLGLGHRRIAILVDRLIDDDVRGLADAASAARARPTRSPASGSPATTTRSPPPASTRWPSRSSTAPATRSRTAARRARALLEPTGRPPCSA